MTIKSYRAKQNGGVDIVETTDIGLSKSKNPNLIEKKEKSKKDIAMLEANRRDEVKAVAAYEDDKKNTDDPKTAALIDHIETEEEQHQKELKEAIESNEETGETFVEMDKSKFKFPIEKAFTKYPKYKEKRLVKDGKVEYIYNESTSAAKSWKKQMQAAIRIDNRVSELKNKIGELKALKDAYLAPVIDALKGLDEAVILTISGEKKYVLYEGQSETTEYKKLYLEAYDRLNKNAKEQMDKIEVTLKKINTYYKTKVVEKSGKDHAIMVNELVKCINELKQYYKERLELCKKVHKSYLPKLTKAKPLYTDKVVTNRTEMEEDEEEDVEKSDGAGMSTAMGSGGDVTTIGQGSYPKTKKKLRKKKVDLMKAIKARNTKLIKSIKEEIKSLEKSKGPWKKGKRFESELSAKKGFKQVNEMQRKEVMAKIKEQNKKYEPSEEEILDEADARYGIERGQDISASQLKTIINALTKQNSSKKSTIKLPIEKCGDSHRKHTPIVSEKQRGFFGAEMSRAAEGKKTKSGMSKDVLSRHLKEAASKKLPKQIKKKGKK